MSRSILKNTSKIGILALISRCIAFFREVLLIRFLSVGATSDIFFTAFRIPNTLRKIFAEGLLSSILVPAIVNAKHKGGTKRANQLTTLSFLVIESLIFLFCVIIYYNAACTIRLIVPGWTTEKIQQSGKLLQILISFILFISSGSIFAAALQAQQKFFIPAIAPSILNVLYVTTLTTCLYYNLSIETFCWFMIAIAVCYFLLHVITYLYMYFSFRLPEKTTYEDFKTVLIQFFPCFFSSGISEINHFINTAFASYSPSGSLTLLRYAFQFVNIPIGIIAASLSTVLLPHFSKVSLENPKSLSKQIYDAITFTLWSTTPICFLLGFFSKEIFQTLFLGDAQALHKVFLAKSIFIAYLIGLLPLSLNKVFLSIFYALRLSIVPMITTCISIFTNFTLNKILLNHYEATGIAFSYSIASVIQAILLFITLHIHLKLPFAWKDYSNFVYRYAIQLLSLTTIFWAIFRSIYYAISKMHFTHTINLGNIKLITLHPGFFLESIGVWMWAGPLSLLLIWTIYATRKIFSVQISYLDKE